MYKCNKLVRLSSLILLRIGQTGESFGHEAPRLRVPRDGVVRERAAAHHDEHSRRQHTEGPDRAADVEIRVRRPERFGSERPAQHDCLVVNRRCQVARRLDHRVRPVRHEHAVASALLDTVHQALPARDKINTLFERKDIVSLSDQQKCNKCCILWKKGSKHELLPVGIADVLAVLAANRSVGDLD